MVFAGQLRSFLILYLFLPPRLFKKFENRTHGYRGCHDETRNVVQIRVVQIRMVLLVRFVNVHFFS